jgi:hypothetical protein
MQFTINGQAVESIDITTDEGGITMRLSRLGLGLGVLPVGGGFTGPPTAFIMLGQSNMVGKGYADGLGDHPAGIMQVARNGKISGGATGAVVQAVSPLDHYTPAIGEQGLDLGLTSAWLAVNPATSILYIPGAAGSTGFAAGQWVVGGLYYNNAISQANTYFAANPDTVLGGIMWHQGEHSIANGYTKTYHMEKLDAMIAGLRNNITAATDETPFIVGQLLEAYVAANGATGAAIQAAITETPDRVPYTALVSSSSLVGRGDGLHFDAASLRTMGGRYYDALAVAQANAPVESGALAHWLLGTDNATDADLVSGQTLTNAGAVTRETNHLSYTAQGHYSDTGIADQSTITFSGVYRIDAAQVQGMMAGHWASNTAGFALFADASSLRYNAGNGTASHTLSARVSDVWLFIAVSLTAAGDVLVYLGDATTTVTRTSGSGSRGAIQGVNLTISDGRANGLFTGKFDCAEFIVWGAGKSVADFNAIYLRSRARMAARGVTIV